jgi:hypothetical protein
LFVRGVKLKTIIAKKNMNQGNTKSITVLFTVCFLLSGIFITKASAEIATGKSTTKQTSITKTKPKSKPVIHNRNKTFMKRQWGVEVLFVRQTSAGYMLEFRYKVLDAEKAKPLFERQTKPVMTHLKTGRKLIVPTPAKTGALRNSNLPKAGTTYWMFFANPGKLVKPGEKVNINIGKFQVKDLVVK